MFCGHTLLTGELRKIIFSFHVPLFFFLSGICFKSERMKNFISKKLKKMYMPYIIVSIISIIIYMVLGNFIKETDSILNFEYLKINIFGMIYCNSNLYNMQWNQPLWFIPSLLILTIIVNIIELVIKNSNKQNIIRIVAIIIIGSVGYYLSKMKVFLPFHLETAMVMILWFYLGLILRNILKNMSSKIYLKNIYYVISYIVLIIFITIACAIAYKNDIVSIRQDRYGHFFMYIMAAGLFIFSIILISMLIKKNRILEYIGRNTLYILLLHKFPILIFQKVSPFTKNNLNNPESIKVICMAIGITIFDIIVCISIGYSIKKIKKSGEIYDKNKKQI